MGMYVMDKQLLETAELSGNRLSNKTNGGKPRRLTDLTD